MARGKNAPALFEVIRNAQEKQRQQDLKLRQQADSQQAVAHAQPPGTAESTGAAAANLLKSPLFWFKGRSAHEQQVGKIARPSEPVMREVPRPAAPRSAIESAIEKIAADAASGEPASPPAESIGRVPAPAYRPAVSDYAPRVREEIAAQEAPAAEPLFAGSAFAAPNSGTRSAVSDDADSTGSGSTIGGPYSARRGASEFRSGKPEISIDRDRRQISMRLSYNAAIIAGFAVIVACGLAFLIGSAGRNKSTAVAEAAPQPGVMDVRPDKSTSVADNTRTTTPDGPRSNGGGIDHSGDHAADHFADHSTDARASGGGDHSQTALDNGGRPIPIPTNVSRTVGLQYVVVFSSPSQQEVESFVKFLADNGTAATAERALPGYSAAWYSVVGTRSFERISKNPQYDVYVANLIKLSKKYSQQTQKYVGGKPQAYTWKATK